MKTYSYFIAKASKHQIQNTLVQGCRQRVLTHGLVFPGRTKEMPLFLGSSTRMGLAIESAVNVCWSDTSLSLPNCCLLHSCGNTSFLFYTSFTSPLWVSFQMKLFTLLKAGKCSQTFLLIRDLCNVRLVFLSLKCKSISKLEGVAQNKFRSHLKVFMEANFVSQVFKLT